MRKLVLVLMMYGLIYGSAGAQCEPEVIIGEFMGIPAFSNEPNTESGSGCYQCVHLVKRFSERYHGGFGRVECGANMWNVLPRDYSYLAIANNSSTAPPQVGDLIIWWQDNWDCVTRFGHVGIVCWVTDSEVGVFEQNIDNSTKPFRQLPMTKRSDGTWSVGSGPRLSNYEVKGWLRYPGFKVPAGMKFDGEYDQLFVEAYNTNSHYFLGNAKDNGGSPFVHDWYGYQVQDFEKGILVQNPLTKQVFPVVGGFYQVWLGTGDPRIYGAPKEAERYDTNWAEQEFEKATFRWDGQRVMVFVNGQLVVIREDENGYDTLTSPDVFMTMIYGDGVTLNILAYAKSESEIVVSGSWILDAVR